VVQFKLTSQRCRVTSSRCKLSSSSSSSSIIDSSFTTGSARRTSLLRASAQLICQGGAEPLRLSAGGCILDATKLSYYYRSRSKARVKGYIPFEPAAVTLVTPPFVVHAGHHTTEHDCVALVWYL
jgi:hypothetical protein